MSSHPPRAPAAAPAGGTTGGLKLATFLPYRINVLATVLSDGLARLYEERFGIGIPEWRVIATVGEFGSITAKGVGLHAPMGKVKVSRAAAALERKGLISRLPNEDDLREAFLVLTKAGEAAYGEIAPLALAYVAEVSVELTPAECEQLDAIVDKLLRGAGVPASGDAAAGARPRVTPRCGPPRP